MVNILTTFIFESLRRKPESTHARSGIQNIMKTRSSGTSPEFHPGSTPVRILLNKHINLCY